jgi:hypothetical protein
MSKTIFGQYYDFIQSRKDKLINMLISEIIFLKRRFRSTKNNEELSYLKEALDKLDYLLDKLKENSFEISERDFDKITMMIYHIFKEIAIKLE